jgi:hypothetical protein
MKKFIDNLQSRHKNFWTKGRIISLLTSLLFLVTALFIQKFANDYVKIIKGIAVDDILLNHLPTVDIDSLIIQIVLILTFVIIWLLLVKPNYIIFTIKALAIFIVIRAFFISLTHLGINPQELAFDPNSFGFRLYDFLYNTRGDFFFSGHTGLPFLIALIFWQEKVWRFFFLAVALILGIFVLLAHMHYSIDVFAAPFITFSIFYIARYLFAKDFVLIEPKRNNFS